MKSFPNKTNCFRIIHTIYVLISTLNSTSSLPDKWKIDCFVRLVVFCCFKYCSKVCRAATTKLYGASHIRIELNDFFFYFMIVGKDETTTIKNNNHREWLKWNIARQWVTLSRMSFNYMCHANFDGIERFYWFTLELLWFVCWNFWYYVDGIDHILFLIVTSIIHTCKWIPWLVVQFAKYFEICNEFMNKLNGSLSNKIIVA